MLIRPTVLITCVQLHSYTVLYKRKKIIIIIDLLKVWTNGQ